MFNFVELLSSAFSYLWTQASSQSRMALTQTSWRANLLQGMVARHTHMITYAVVICPSTVTTVLVLVVSWSMTTVPETQHEVWCRWKMKLILLSVMQVLWVTKTKAGFYSITRHLLFNVPLLYVFNSRHRAAR